jgi:hypothetical protein
MLALVMCVFERAMAIADVVLGIIGVDHYIIIPMTHGSVR